MEAFSLHGTSFQPEKLDNQSSRVSAVEILSAAFQDYPPFAHFCPNEFTRCRFVHWLFQRWVVISYSVPGSQVVGWRDMESKRMVAVSILLAPLQPFAGGLGFVDAPLPTLLKHGLAEVPFRFGPAAAVRILQVLLAQDSVERRLGAAFGSHWYENYVCVDPRIQCKGLGSSILEAQAAHTCESNRPIVLNTYAVRARPFYRRNGFQELGWHLNGRPVWWYIRGANLTLSAINELTAALGLSSEEPQTDFLHGMSKKREVLLVGLVILCMPFLALTIIPACWVWRTLR